MDGTQQTYRKAFFYGLSSYLVLFIFSIVFYKERTIFTDIAYQTYFIVKNNAFSIQNFRYVAFFTQLFPLLSAKLHLSLNAILISYSAGFIVFYLACYIACGLWLKNYRLALVLLLCNVLFVAHTFFWIQSELPQGLALFIFTIALALKEYKGARAVIATVVVIAGLFTVAMAHPLLKFAVYYSFAFLLLDKSTTRKKYLAALLVAYYISLWVKQHYFGTAYEVKAIKASEELQTIAYWSHYQFTQVYTNQVFLYNCAHKYLWMTVLFVAGICNYIYLKQWLKLLLLLIIPPVYILLVNSSFPLGSTPQFYIENMYLPVGIFLGLPFVYDMVPQLAKWKIANAFILVFAATLTLNIFLVRKLYAKRLSWEKTFLHEHRDKKLIVDGRLTPGEILIFNWATPYEFWLLSTTEQHKTASIIITDNIDQFDANINRPKAFIGPWETNSYSELNKPYFILEDTVSVYTKIKP